MIKFLIRLYKPKLSIAIITLYLLGSALYIYTFLEVSQVSDSRISLELEQLISSIERSPSVNARDELLYRLYEVRDLNRFIVNPGDTFATNTIYYFFSRFFRWELYGFLGQKKE